MYGWLLLHYGYSVKEPALQSESIKIEKEKEHQYINNMKFKALGST